MKSVQRWRASNTFTETQWAALMASATQRGAFSRGAFALVVADADGAFVALYQKGQSGSSAGAFKAITTGIGALPAAPGSVLLDAAAPNTNVRLGTGGVGTSINDVALLTALVAVGAVNLTSAQALSNKTLTDPRVSSSLLAADGTKVATINAIATPDSWVNLTAGDMPATPPKLSADGSVANVSLTIAAKGTGVVAPSRMVTESGTTAQITGGVGVFASPTAGLMAFCTDNAAGPVPCWYTGAAWVLASGVPI